jgi:hypothetical protein
MRGENAHCFVLSAFRGLVGALERQHRWGSNTRQREQTQDELVALLPSLSSRELPRTMALSRWDTKLENAEELLDEARLEVDAATEKRLASD